MSKQRNAASARPDLPQTIRRSDTHAQQVWKAAYDSAHKTPGDEGRAQRVALEAVRREFEKRGRRGVPKAAAPPQRPATRGPAGAPKAKARSLPGRVGESPG